MNLINKLLDDMDSDGVIYVHWKSNNNIDKAISGEDDLDILVSENSMRSIYRIFRDLGFERAYTVKDRWQKGILHYLSMDADSGALVHVHLHFKLSMGYDYDKSLQLPIEETYLSGRQKHKNIYIPEPEKEYVVLVLRLILKNGIVPFGLSLPTAQLKVLKRISNYGVVPKSSYSEFLYLKNKISRERLKEVLVEFDLVSGGDFEFFESIVKKNNSLVDYFKGSRVLRSRLKGYFNCSAVSGFFKSLYRLNRGRVSTLFKDKSYFKKKPLSGGRIVAFIGGDGAGKSTNIDKLGALLSRHYNVVAIHFGRPKKTVYGLLFRVASKISKLCRNEDLSLVFMYLAIAKDRLGAFQRAEKIKSRGGIVIMDRMHLPEITIMDCPRVANIANASYRNLASLEERIYKNIGQVDKLVVLKLDPSIALQRRPEDDPEELLKRSGQIWEGDFSSYPSIVVNTSQSYADVERSINESVWSTIKSNRALYELVGVAGSGKSTAIKYLKEKDNDIVERPKLARYSMLPLLMPHAWRGVYMLIRTSNLGFFKGYIYIKFLLRELRGRNNSRNIIFDQGGVFCVATLLQEFNGDWNGLLLDYDDVLEYFDGIILLDAPDEILISRIGARGQLHRIENLDEDGKKYFLGKYRKIYSMLLDRAESKGVSIVRIDTSDNDEISTANLIFDEVFK